MVLGLAALALGPGWGCGRRIDLPGEPDMGNGQPGEVAYYKKYAWNSMPLLSDLLVTRGQLFFAVVDSALVRSYFSDAATPRENASRSIPDPVVLAGDTLRRPVQVCEGAGSTIWVAYRRPRSQVVQFDVSVSPPVTTGLRVRNTGTVEFGGLAADPDSGFVYVADTQANTVSKFAPTTTGGNLVARLAIDGMGDGYVRAPRGIYFFQDSLLVADSGKDWLQVISADRPANGRGQVEIKRRDEQGQLQSEPIKGPSDVWVDAVGFFYVADTGNSRVLKLKRSGEIKEVVTEFDPYRAMQPLTMAASPTLVWVADPDSARLTIYQINTSSEGLP